MRGIVLDHKCCEGACLRSASKQVWACLVMCGLVALALFLLVAPENVKWRSYVRVLFVNVLLLFGVLISSKLTALISSDKSVLISPRIDFYGLPYLYLLVAVFIVRSRVVWAKNVLLILLTFIIPMSVLRTVEAQKVWKLGFDAERETVLDIVHRLGSNEAFDINKGYRLLVPLEKVNVGLKK